MLKKGNEAPYIVPCKKCGMHAHFVFPDRSESKEFYLLEHGEEILVDAHMKGIIDDYEHGRLADQLKRAGVPTPKDFMTRVVEKLGPVIAAAILKAIHEKKDLDEFLKDKEAPTSNGCIMN